MDETQQLKLFSYLESLFDDKISSLWTSQPATIKSFDSDNNTLSCTLDREGIPLRDIPITILGNPQSYITTPTLSAGTKGLLLFSRHDLKDWVGSGIDSEAKLDHSKNNAFFLTGVTNQKNKISYNMDAIEIKTDKAVEISAQIHTNISSPKISLSNGSDELFTLLLETLTELKAMSQILVTTHGLVGVTPYIVKYEALSQKFGGFIDE